jgi:hypothetical protein
MGGTKGKNINSMISKEKKDHSLVEGDETKRRYDNGVLYVLSGKQIWSPQL